MSADAIIAALVGTHMEDEATRDTFTLVVIGLCWPQMTDIATQVTHADKVIRVAFTLAVRGPRWPQAYGRYA